MSERNNNKSVDKSKGRTVGSPVGGAVGSPVGGAVGSRSDTSGREPNNSYIGKLSNKYNQPGYYKYYGIAAAIIVVFIWSGWLIISKWGVTHSLTNRDILLLRFVTASTIVLPFLARYKLSEIAGLFRPQVILVSLSVGVPYVWLSFAGLEVISTAQSGVLINGCFPIFTILLFSFLLGNKPTWMQLVGIALILGGNIMLIIDEGDAITFRYEQFFLLGASLCMAIYTVGNILWSIKLREIMIVAPVTNLIVILPLWLMHDSAIATSPIGESLLQASYQGVLVSVIVLWLMGTALKYISGQIFSLIMAMVPIIAAFLAFFILKEPLTPAIIAGALLCVLGIISVNLFQKKIVK
ncbi:MAG: DMT family transporter [Gammaproteobacteria bacterium]|nr:DMT family transporter [Gammaproteobacteria bacterium]